MRVGHAIHAPVRSVSASSIVGSACLVMWLSGSVFATKIVDPGVLHAVNVAKNWLMKKSGLQHAAGAAVPYQLSKQRTSILKERIISITTMMTRMLVLHHHQIYQLVSIPYTFD